MMRAWLHPRLLGFIWALTLVPVLIALVPFGASVSDELLYQPQGAALLHSDTYLLDLGEALSQQSRVLTVSGVMAALVALLLGPAVSGAIVAGLRKERLIAGAARDYGRQMRLALLGLLPLVLAVALGAPALVWVNKYSESAVREAAVDQLWIVAALFAGLMLLCALAWVECARVATVRSEARIGAWHAFAIGTRMFFRRFFRVMPAFATPVLVALLLTLLIMYFRARTQHLWLGHVVPFVWAWARVARLNTLRAL